MPRIANESSALLADLHARMQRLIEAARTEGRAKALAEIRSLVGAGGMPAKRGPGRPRKSESAAAAGKPKKRRKNSWAGLSPAQRLARVNAIRKGKGLPPRSE